MKFKSIPGKITGFIDNLTSFIYIKIKHIFPTRITPGHILKAALGITTTLFVLIIISALLRARLISPPVSPIFEDRHGTFLTEGLSEHAIFGYWDVPEEIPHRIKECILIIEDKRFYKHMGIDLYALGRAFFNNLTGGKQQGASTIAMQVARLQYPGERNIWNKTVEMFTGFFLTVFYGHEQVLRHYMKIVPQGNQMFGFAYAARRYFRKPLQDLSWGEAAVLASLPQAPGEMNLFSFRGFRKALERARLILSLLYKEEKIQKEDYIAGLRQLSELRFQIKEERPFHAYHFIFRLLSEYGKRDIKNLTHPLRSTLDLNIQDFLQSLATSAMIKYRPYGAGNIALLVVDKATGQVLGYIGSENYFDKDFAGAINYARTPRSSGSTLKPFLFALGLDLHKYTPASIVADLPLHIISPLGEYSAANFDEEFMGPMLYRRALANSRNTPTLRILETVGLEETYDFFKTTGLTNSDKPAGYYGYGLPLGGLYVTLEDLVQAYGILANDGRDFTLKWFLEDSSTPGKQLISEYAARQISLFLSDPLARLPSFPRLCSLEFPFPVAIKTGTSQGFRDAWTVAYSDKYIIGVWMGHPQNEPMNYVSGSVAAYLIQEIIYFLQPEEVQGINIAPFPPPRNSVAVKICLLSGKPATADCAQVSLEYFKEGTEPHLKCDVHRRINIDITTGAIANEYTPQNQIESVLFVVLPPEYATWGVKQGFGKPPLEASGPPRTSISLIHPLNGLSLLIDPEVPRKYQSIPLRAKVTPAVPEIVFYVDGEEYEHVPYPYETRWQLEEGIHSFQARFPNANVISEVVTVKVDPYY